MSALRVVTLPPGLEPSAAVTFAHEAAGRGAQLLELRTDLHSTNAPVRTLAKALPLVVSERGQPVPSEWAAVAEWIDRPLEAGIADRGKPLLSHHSAEPMTTDAAVTLWLSHPVSPGAGIKHVEPLGDLRKAWRLLETQRQLQQRFRKQQVTVLAMGELALPFRCVLAERNALDYVALRGDWRAAPGQRLLDDAVREARTSHGGPRRGILGTGIDGSRSPRIHPQPFDRLDLPEGTDVGALLEVLRPFYAGFSITSPFKKAAARSVNADLDAINTLSRTASGWTYVNTDIEGAAAALARFGATHVTVLGEGGAAPALRSAAKALNVELTFIKRDQSSAELSGNLLWTWPDRVTPPDTLRFHHARVGVIAYGSSGIRIARLIRERGGQPIHLGPRWFIAQARGQRRSWGIE